MRLVETETGLITAAMTESFGSSAETSAMVESLAEGLLERLEKLYPFRGKISQISGDEIQLNIGQRAGVGQGQRFAVLDRDMVLEVTSVQPDTSFARVAEGDGKPQEGDRVESL